MKTPIKPTPEILAALEEAKSDNVRSVEDIKRQLDDFEKASKSAIEYGERDFASKTALDGIKRHKKDLEEELAKSIKAQKQLEDYSKSSKEIEDWDNCQS